MTPESKTLKQIKNVQWLALSDYRHEWHMSVCFILALASVLAPLMVLFGLKFGIVSSMIDELVNDPSNREIRVVGSGHYDANWFATMRQRDDVAFIMPRTRLIAGTVDLSNPAAGRIISAELIPSGDGDPVLDGLGKQIRELETAVVSAAAARKLHLQTGDTINASLTRQYRGKRERVQHALKIVAIAPEAAFSRDGVFVSLEMLKASEAYRDGRAVPALNWPGDEAASGNHAAAQEYPLFRLYANELDDVATLRDLLSEQGIEVRTEAAQIEVVQRTDRNLSVIFWIIALVGLFGFGLSLGASLWANIERKNRELSVLRLVGFRSLDIIWFPLFQSLLTGFFGWALAAGLYFGIENAINLLFTDRTICLLLPQHYLSALGLTLLCAVFAALLGGLRAAKVQPSDGLREA